MSKVFGKLETHEDACGRQLVPHFVRNINTDLKENSSRYRSCFFKAPEFSQINFSSGSLSLTGEINFFKSHIQLKTYLNSFLLF